MSTSSKLKAIRTALSLTQEDFSDGLDISQAALSYLEKGDSQMSLPVIRNLINIYEVNPYFILGDGKDEPMFMRSRAGNMEMRELRSKLARVKKSLATIKKEVEVISKSL